MFRRKIMSLGRLYCFMIALFACIAVIGGCSSGRAGSSDSPGDTDPAKTTYNVDVIIPSGVPIKIAGEYFYAFAYPANSTTHTPANAIAQSIVSSIQGGDTSVHLRWQSA